MVLKLSQWQFISGWCKFLETRSLGTSISQNCQLWGSAESLPFSTSFPRDEDGGLQINVSTPNPAPPAKKEKELKNNHDCTTDRIYSCRNHERQGHAQAFSTQDKISLGTQGFNGILPSTEPKSKAKSRHKTKEELRAVIQAVGVVWFAALRVSCRPEPIGTATCLERSELRCRRKFFTNKLTSIPNWITWKDFLSIIILTKNLRRKV